MSYTASMNIGAFLRWIEKESGKTGYRICEDGNFPKPRYYSWKKRKSLVSLNKDSLRQLQRGSGIDSKTFALKLWEFIEG